MNDINAYYTICMTDGERPTDEVYNAFLLLQPYLIALDIDIFIANWQVMVFLRGFQ